MRTLRLIQHILLIVAVALYGIAPVGAHSMAAHVAGSSSSTATGIEGPHEHCAGSAESLRGGNLSDNLPQGSGSPHVPDCCQGSACSQGCLALTFLITGSESRDLLLAPSTERFSGWRITLTSLSVPPDLRPPIA